MTRMIYSPHQLIRQLIEFIGDDPDREGLKETPNRVVASYKELFSGYQVDVASLFKTFDPAGYDELIVLRDIPFYSMCEHHMLPFHGVAHVGYVPSEKVIGLSKLARLVDAFSRRLQMQERITKQVTDALEEYLSPVGAACVIEGTHLCTCSRGVNKQGATMLTSSLTGCFRDNAPARAEFFQLIKH